MEILFVVALLLIFSIPLGQEVYSWFDHSHWELSAQPDINAHVSDFSAEKVQFLKNGAKYKTTVTFSDGFSFITHKTNTKGHFGYYTISIDGELKNQILSKAVEAHTKAVMKKTKSEFQH